MANAAPGDEERAWMKTALQEIEPLRRRISVPLLPEASPGTVQVTTNDRVHFLLEFIDMELRAFLAVLRGRLEWKQQAADCIVWHGMRIDDDANEYMKQEWLEGIGHLARLIQHLLDGYKRPPPRYAVLLHRSGSCYCHTTTAEPEDWCEIEEINGWLAFLAPHPLVYKHLLLVGGDGDDTASTSAGTYHHLSFWLKLFLLYMVSMFPQGHKFDKNCLIWKWESEGLTRRIRWDDWESQTEKYFSELVDRDVIIEAANYGHKPAAGAEDCRWQVNPDMLQFFTSESANKGFVCTSGMLNSAAGGNSDSTEILRRLSLHQPDRGLPRQLETMELSHTRSLAVSGAVGQIPLDGFTYLRVLDLEGWENLKDEDLLQICSKMLLLRYLSIGNTRVTRLPPVIKELCFLETLNISCTKISELPSEACELQYLRILDLRSTQIRELPSEACELQYLRILDLRSTQIRQLPEQIVELRNLRSLLVGGDGINPNEAVAKIPEGVVRCGVLRTLATVDLREWSASSVKALGSLQYLEVLAITWSFHQCADGRYQDALRSSIKHWKYPKSLTIHCGLSCSMEFLDSLDSPPKTLEKFKVTTGRFVTLPKWIQGLEYLSFLQITICKLEADDLRILGEFPLLRCLVLGLEFNPKKAIVIKRKSWFKQLRTFSVDCPVPWLTFGEGAMSELTYLDLEICSGPLNEESIPSGITYLGKLREVVLRYSKWCSDSSSVKKTVEAVKKEVAKHRGLIKLVINGTQHGVQAEAVDVETVRKTTTEIQSETENEGEIESEA